MGCLNDSPLAGYTYLGQFIDHDLTRDRTPLLQAELTPIDDMVNEHTPWLDLDHLYGAHPTLSEEWFDKSSPDSEKRLRLDRTRPGGPPFNLPGGDELDLPRNDAGSAAIADSRNAENLILAQIHVLFARLHNLALDQLKDGAVTCPDVPGSENTIFDKARRLVTWQYQWLVRNEFLRRIVYPNMLQRIRAQRKFLRRFRPENVFMPVEFAAAAFRFGHSLVRPSYRINGWQSQSRPGGKVPLQELLCSAQPLGHDWLIDWTTFFESSTPPSERETALPINPQLADPLHNLPDCAIHVFVRRLHADEPRELPVRTLWRGRALLLPTGQDVARYFGEKPLGREELNRDRHGKLLPCGETLIELSLTEATPLWYYILWEAERPPYCGNRLGPVGARIVVEVLDRLTECDPNSFLNAPGGEWKPVGWRFPDGKGRPVMSMRQLLELLGGGLPPRHPPHRAIRLSERADFLLRALRRWRANALS